MVQEVNDEQRQLLKKKPQLVNLNKELEALRTQLLELQAFDRKQEAKDAATVRWLLLPARAAAAHSPSRTRGMPQAGKRAAKAKRATSEADSAAQADEEVPVPAAAEAEAAAPAEPAAAAAATDAAATAAAVGGAGATGATGAAGAAGVEPQVHPTTVDAATETPEPQPHPSASAFLGNVLPILALLQVYSRFQSGVDQHQQQAGPSALVHLVKVRCAPAAHALASTNSPPRR